MSDTQSLAEAFGKTRQQVGGHGRRTVGILKEALGAVASDTAADTYGGGDIIERFERKIADYLGKEAAVFFPSGTMAQQIALRIWCDQANLYRVAYHPLCHLEIHEQDGLKMLHHIDPVLLGEASRLISLDDVTALDQAIACLLLELPQREIGGQLADFSTLQAIAQYCRAHGIRLHLDGARLYETLPFYQKTAAEVVSLFDSVYVSFYKGVGGVAGAMLAGDRAFIEKAIVWKRRHGGDLISLYPYILAADHFFDVRVSKMDQYYRQARELAARFNRCHSVSTLPEIPVTNMFHVHVHQSPAAVQDALIATYQTAGLGFANHLTAVTDQECSFEVSIGDQYADIPADLLDRAFETLDRELRSRSGL